MNREWIPWCWNCGVEDRGIIGMGPVTVATELIPRLRCRGCGKHVVALEIAS